MPLLVGVRSPTPKTLLPTLRIGSGYRNDAPSRESVKP
jgi:hypothetical protein